LATSSILVKDASGKTYPAQIIGGKMTPPGYTSKVQFVVDSMPAGGYRSFYVDATQTGIAAESGPIPFTDNTFETDFYRIKFDMSTGNIISLFDKSLQKELVKQGAQLNTFRIGLEDHQGTMKNWLIHKFVRTDVVSDVKSVKLVENGPVRACVEAVKYWGKSKFIIRTYIYKAYPRIAYDVDMNWLETGDRENDSPMLRTAFPLDIPNAEFYCQVPFDVAKRPIDFMFEGKPVPNTLRQTGMKNEIYEDKGDGIEVPAQKWSDLNNGSFGVALLNRSKYGYSVHNGELRLTLMRAAGEPDPFPNIGKFRIQYALYPHSGNWTNGVCNEGEDFNLPVFAAEPPSLSWSGKHATRPEEASFLQLAPANIILTGMKQGVNEKELVVRFFETEGKASTATLTLPFAPKSVRRLNFVELPLEDAAKTSIQGNTITITVKPHEIITLGIKK
jgi:alpha-mannosidase